MPKLKVLGSKLLAIDGLATCAITTDEVTTQKHEVRDGTVEGRAFISKARLASAKATDVGHGLRYDLIKRVEGDFSGLGLTSEVRLPP